MDNKALLVRTEGSASGMRMTRESYAKEVWKAVLAVREGAKDITCPHEDCSEKLRIFSTSIQAGTTIVCSQHGFFFRE